jgi:hypothetical protein
VLNSPDQTLPPFTNVHRASLIRILIFSQVSEQRDAKIVLERLATALSTIHIHHVIFTLYDPEQDFDSTTGKDNLVLVKFTH